MVDWDRVEELRSKDWDWRTIAEDPKVGFHADESAGDPGRALRALYHRHKARRERQAPAPTPSKRVDKDSQARWTVTRFGYLAVAVSGIWLALAYAAPSPVGLLVPAFPWLALVFAAFVFLLLWSLWRGRSLTDRSSRWSPVLRTTVIGGVILGLVFSGMIGLVGALVFGCPYLPPASTLHGQPAGWSSGSLPTWQDGGKPVAYFYGATWCPYCSASSWAIWKALMEFGTVTGNSTGMSSSTDVYPQTPEMVLANVQYTSSLSSFQVSEYNGGVDGTSPSTSTCIQQAYVSAYSGGAIPFMVVGGVYVHAGTSIVNPQLLSNWSKGANGGPGYVAYSVLHETGTPWSVVQDPACWIMAYLAKAVNGATGTPIATIASENHWSSGVTSLTESYYAQIT